MIKLNNLTVAYNDNTVISDLTYEFAKGNTAITGSSGIGKTSLINAILSLVPYKGTIESDEKYSVVFQEDRLCPYLTALWQIISAVISSPVFLPSPLQTVNAIFSLLKTSAYYKSLSYSLLNISIGFFTGLFAGVVLAVAASVNTFLQSVIDVPVKIIRSIPVASFIILALLWVDSAHLSTFIADRKSVV